MFIASTLSPTATQPFDTRNVWKAYEGTTSLVRRSSVPEIAADYFGYVHSRYGLSKMRHSLGPTATDQKGPMLLNG
jgi:hypothetical protein